MYKVIIAEDEARLRRALRITIQWDALGFEVIGEAENGKAAFELVRELQPDLLITDVRMPYMDGLELIKAVKEYDGNIKTVIISGYSEFQYALKAIEYSVVSYLLKPLEDEKLELLLMDIKAALDKERRQVREQEELKGLMKKRHVHAWEMALLNAVKGNYENEEMIETELQHSGISLQGQNFLAVLFDFDEASILEQLSEQSKQEFLSGIMTGVEENLGNWNRYLIAIENCEILAIICMDCCPREDQLKAIQGKLSTIKSTIMSEVSVTIGFSNPVSGTSNIKKAFSEARKAVENRMILGKNKIIPYNDISKSGNYKRITSFNNEQELMNYLYSGSEEKLGSLIDICFDKFSVGIDITADDVYKLCIEIAIVIEKFICTQGINMGDIFQNNINWLKEVRHFKTIQEIKYWLKQILLKTINSVKILQNNDKNQIIDKAKDFIRMNLLNNIGLNDVADFVYLSPNYFSNTFKQVTGENFSEYFIRLKIDKAKQMLGENSDKIYTIASKLGYLDIKYFSNLFKKEVGVAPAVYREMNLNNYRQGQTSSFTSDK